MEAPGIESPATSAPSVADRRVNDTDSATEPHASRPDVSASTPLDTDAAIRSATKLAIDADDVDRARALLDLLDAKPRPSLARVVTLATRRPPR